MYNSSRGLPNSLPRGVASSAHESPKAYNFWCLSCTIDTRAKEIYRLEIPIILTQLIHLLTNVLEPSTIQLQYFYHASAELANQIADSQVDTQYNKLFANGTRKCHYNITHEEYYDC